MTDGYFGQQGITDGNDLFNAIRFMIQQEIKGVRTGIPVKIIAVHGGGVGAPPTVDVQPMVNQTDGQGNATAHGVIYGLPVARNQGGRAGLIVDPVVGDIGHLIASDRDTSALRANAGAQSNPGSFRHHDLADGTYHGAVLNKATPNRYINLNGPGIHVADEFGNSISTNGDGVLINGVKIDRSGNIYLPAGADLYNSDGTTFTTHTHPTAPPGPPSAPTPGS